MKYLIPGQDVYVLWGYTEVWPCKTCDHGEGSTGRIMYKGHRYPCPNCRGSLQEPDKVKIGPRLAHVVERIHTKAGRFEKSLGMAEAVHYKLSVGPGSQPFLIRTKDIYLTLEYAQQTAERLNKHKRTFKDLDIRGVIK